MTQIIDRRAGRGTPAQRDIDGEPGTRQLRRKDERERGERAARREAEAGGIGLSDYFVGHEGHPVRRGELLNMLGMFAEHVHTHYSWRGRLRLWGRRAYYGLRYGVWYQGPSLFTIARDVFHLNTKERQRQAQAQAALTPPSAGATP